MNSAENLFIACMHIRNVRGVLRQVVIALTLLLCFMALSRSYAQDDEEGIEQGHPIGKVSTQGKLIVLELDDGALGQPISSTSLVARSASRHTALVIAWITAL